MSCCPAGPWRPWKCCPWGMWPHTCLVTHEGRLPAGAEGLCRLHSPTWLGPPKDPVSGWVSRALRGGFAVRTGKGGWVVHLRGVADVGAECILISFSSSFCQGGRFSYQREWQVLWKEKQVVMNEENVGTQAHRCSLAGPRGASSKGSHRSSHADPRWPPQLWRPGPGQPWGQPVVLS